MKTKNKPKSEIHFSQAQIEVWEMKEKIYEKVKHLSLNNALYQIMENSKKVSEQLIKENKVIFS